MWITVKSLIRTFSHSHICSSSICIFTHLNIKICTSIKSLDQLFFYLFEELQRFKIPPDHIVQLTTEVDVVVDIITFKFIDHMLSEVDSCYPAIFNLLEPLLIIAVI